MPGSGSVAGTPTMVGCGGKELGSAPGTPTFGAAGPTVAQQQQQQQQAQQQQLQQARRGGSGPLDHYPCDGGLSLARIGSLTPSGAHTPSACLTPTVPHSPFGDSSRQHRVERQRKMAEAKGRTGGAAGAGLGSPDVASLKRKCETLETENRSLKTFQSFMNRKDSEQTTRIEQLEQENAQLRAENERLREELAAARQTGMGLTSMPTMHAAGMSQP
ncbi:unnamed protein product [Closterium sp. Yama58-4]|nr:unnamed protein product [Closterium sp. Yama58-4]